jgi:precorrin-6y C5,15-methyltransferase (decarboxylating) CbiE subunit
MALNTNEIVIVGCGPGAAEYLTPAGQSAIRRAEVLAGTRRLLETFSPEGVRQIHMDGDMPAMLDEIAACAEHKKVAILVTGDPGLCSLARQVIQRFGRANCRVIPGVSAVQTAFARIGLDWQDARVVSAHGRLPVECPDTLANWKKIAVLAGGEASRQWLSSMAAALSARYEIFVCSDLTLPDERVDCISASEFQTVPLPSRSVVLFIERGCL